MVFLPRFLAVAALVATVGVLRGQVLTESFTGAAGTTPTGWVFSGTGYTPNLTGPADGGGWLRLTSTGGNQATSAYFDTAFAADGATIYASFEFASWGGSGADGITFFLFDGSETFAVGANGGSLGYAQKVGTGADDHVGLAGGYIGVAIDEFGNFSNPTEGRVGGPGFFQDSITVRGSEAADYAYLGGSGTLASSIDTPSVGTRPTDLNQVQILLNATNQLTVTLQQGGTSPQTVLQMDLSAFERPETLKLGFTSGTGGSTNFHEVRNIEASTIVSSLWSNTLDSGEWSANNNWNPTVVPTNGEDVLFDNTFVSTAQVIDAGADHILRSVTFDAPFDYTINNNTLTFDNQGVAGFSGIAATQTHGAADHTINSDIVANNNIYIRNSTTGSLNLNGDLNTNGYTVTFDGTGVATNETGAITGSGNVVKNDPGTVTLGGPSTYSGGTAVNNGTLNANNATALGSGAVALNGGILGSTNGSTVGNSIALNANAGLVGIGTSGTLTQTGGNYTLALEDAAIGGTLNLSNNNTARTLTLDVATASTVSGVIANGGTGAGNLVKNGAGDLTLSGNNSYTGTTTINNGSVILGASNRLNNASDLEIGSNGAFNLNGFSERIDNLTATGDGATLDFGTPGGANQFLFDVYTAPPSGVMVVNNWEQGTDKLASTIGGQDVSSIYLSGFGVAQLAGSTSTIGSLGSGYELTAIAETFKEWDGSSSSNWSTNGNWTSTTEPNSNQAALFDDLGLGRTSVYLNSSYSIRGITFGENAASTYTISSPDASSRTLTLAYATGVPFIQQQSDVDQIIDMDILRLGGNTVVDITGAGNLYINNNITETGGSRALIRDGNGAGKLILDGNNSYSGGLYVNTGIVQAQSSTALGSGAGSISAGATLELAGSGTVGNNLTVTGSGVSGLGALRNVSGSNTLSGTITETGTTRIVADAGSTLTLSGNLTGTNTSTVFAGPGAINASQITTGTGAVTIESGAVAYTGGNANTYTGTTTVNGGSLTLNKTAGVNAVSGNLIVNSGTVSWSQSNQIADSASVTLNNSTTLSLNNRSDAVAQLNSTSATATVALGSGTLTVGAPSVVNSSYTGQITGNGSFTVNGLGTVYLSGNNTSYTGTTNVTAGALNISSYNEVLGSGAINVAAGGNLQVQGGLDIDNAIALNGFGTSNNGALQNFGGSNTVSGSVVLGSASRINASSGALTLSGTITGAGQALTIGGAANTTVTGSIATGSGGLTKDGSGTLTLQTANTYTGATTITGGTVVARHNNALGTNANGTAVAAGATLQLENNVTIAGEALTVSDTGRLLNASGSNSYDGVVSGTGNVWVQSGQLQLGGVNTYTGDTVINGGTLLVSSNSALGSGGTTTVNSGGTLALQNNINVTSQSAYTFAGVGDGNGAVQNLSGNNTLDGGTFTLTADTLITSAGGTLSLGDGASGEDPFNIGAFDLTLNTDGGNMQLNTQLSGSGDIIKEGDGTLLYYMVGNAGHSGTTFVNDGEMQIDTIFDDNNGINGPLVIGDGTGSAQSAILRLGQAPGGSSYNLINDATDVTVNSDGLFDTRGYHELINNLTLDGGAVIGSGVLDRLDVAGDITSTSTTQIATISGLLGLNDTVNAIDVATNSTLDIDAKISNGGFTKTGDGTLNLSGANSFTGAVNITEGIVNASSNFALGNFSGSTTTVSSGAQLQLQGDITVANENLVLNGTGIATDGALRNVSGDNTWTGSVNVASSSLIETVDDSLTVSGSISSGGGTLTVAGAGDTTFSGTVGLGALVKEGTGTLTVSNGSVDSNVYSSATINNGTFALGGGNEILADTMDVTLGANGTFDVNTRTETIADLNGAGTLAIASGGALTVDQLGSGGSPFTGTFDMDSGSTLTLDGGVIGSGANGVGATGTMILAGSGTLQITDDFVFDGTLEMSTGTLLLSNTGTQFDLGTLRITGNSIIDFTDADITTLNLGELIIDPGASITVYGWTYDVDFWSADIWGGALRDTQAFDPTTRVTFNGYSNLETIWLTEGDEITVPEPSTYGAILIGSGLAAFLWRRRRRSGPRQQ